MESNDENEKLISISKAMEITKIKYHIIRRAIHSKQLNAIKPFGEFLINIDELMKWKSFRFQPFQPKEKCKNKEINLS